MVHCENRSQQILRPSAQTIRQYIAIAYQTATEQKLYPKAVLIRSGINRWQIPEGSKAHHSLEKPDLTIMKRNGRPVWPSGDVFQYEIEVAFRPCTR
ncbi:hypothetical protein AFLA70_361g001020 [Aspergillus flavus AF70]|nr:hypothetical protein AFLA70_361g001020 [Aspergillus flavus AF70]